MWYLGESPFFIITSLDYKVLDEREVNFPHDVGWEWHGIQ